MRKKSQQCISMKKIDVLTKLLDALIVALLFGIILFLLSGCGGSGGNSTTQEPVSVPTESDILLSIIFFLYNFDSFGNFSPNMAGIKTGFKFIFFIFSLSLEDRLQSIDCINCLFLYPQCYIIGSLNTINFTNPLTRKNTNNIWI